MAISLEYTDLNGDGRLTSSGLRHGELYGSSNPSVRDAWNANYIGSFAPDSHTGFATADIDDDGDIDLIVGSYSRGDRTGDDGSVSVDGASAGSAGLKTGRGQCLW